MHGGSEDQAPSSSGEQPPNDLFVVHKVRNCSGGLLRHARLPGKPSIHLHLAAVHSIAFRTFLGNVAVDSTESAQVSTGTGIWRIRSLRI